MSEDEHSDSEFYYPDDLESHEENSEATAIYCGLFTATIL